MAKTFKEQLEKEYNKAAEKYSYEKKECVREIQNMTVNLAAEHGAGYTARIERVTAAAVKLTALAEQVRNWNFFNPQDQITPGQWPDIQ